MDPTLLSKAQMLIYKNQEKIYETIKQLPNSVPSQNVGVHKNNFFADIAMKSLNSTNHFAEDASLIEKPQFLSYRRAYNSYVTGKRPSIRTNVERDSRKLNLDEQKSFIPTVTFATDSSLRSKCSIFAFRGAEYLNEIRKEQSKEAASAQKLSQMIHNLAKDASLVGNSQNINYRRAYNSYETSKGTSSRTNVEWDCREPKLNDQKPFIPSATFATDSTLTSKCSIFTFRSAEYLNEIGKEQSKEAAPTVKLLQMNNNFAEDASLIKKTQFLSYRRAYNNYVTGKKPSIRTNVEQDNQELNLDEQKSFIPSATFATDQTLTSKCSIFAFRSAEYLNEIGKERSKESVPAGKLSQSIHNLAKDASLVAKSQAPTYRRSYKSYEISKKTSSKPNVGGKRRGPNLKEQKPFILIATFATDSTLTSKFSIFTFRRAEYLNEIRKEQSKEAAPPKKPLKLIKNLANDASLIGKSESLCYRRTYNSYEIKKKILHMLNFEPNVSKNRNGEYLDEIRKDQSKGAARPVKPLKLIKNFANDASLIGKSQVLCYRRAYNSYEINKNLLNHFEPNVWKYPNGEYLSEIRKQHSERAGCKIPKKDVRNNTKRSSRGIENVQSTNADYQGVTIIQRPHKLKPLNGVKSKNKSAERKSLKIELTSGEVVSDAGTKAATSQNLNLGTLDMSKTLFVPKWKRSLINEPNQPKIATNQISQKNILIAVLFVLGYIALDQFFNYIKSL